MQEEKSNKTKFITLLKQYLTDRNGTSFYEQIHPQLSPSLFINTEEEGAKQCFSGYSKT